MGNVNWCVSRLARSPVLVKPEDASSVYTPPSLKLYRPKMLFHAAASRRVAWLAKSSFVYVVSDTVVFRYPDAAFSVVDRLIMDSFRRMKD